MEVMVSPLVLTKYRVPARRASIVSRARLVKLLGGDQDGPFGLVCAPAGYGKTTLLVDWAQKRFQDGWAVAWYALDTSDDALIPFSAYLVASLLLALGPTPELERLAQLLRTSPETDLDMVLQSVINAVVLSGQKCALVVDDYHLITSPAIHSAMTFLLEHIPENMRVVVGSRSDPPFPLARMRVRGQLLEVRAADLRFTSGEIKTFLKEVMKLELSPDGVAELETKTEGWIAGLQLAALSLAGRPDVESFIVSFTGSHRYLVGYLMGEVVHGQTEEVRAFLAATSILERMCAPLCDAICGGNCRSETILSHLEQANLFVVALDDEGRWYRYHHLFREFLLSRVLKDQPERVGALRHAASEWLAANGFLLEAAQQAFQTGDWEYAADFVERHGFTMILHSEVSTVHEWCSTIPEEVIRTRPLLCILQCWPLVLRFRRQNRPKIEARLRQAEYLIAAMEGSEEARGLSEHAAVVRTFLTMAPDPTADPNEQLKQCRSMLVTYPDGDPGQFSAMLASGYAYMAMHNTQAAETALEQARQLALRGGLFFGVVESTFHLSRLAHSQGRLRHAAELCRQGKADIAAVLSHPEQELPAVGCLDIALGCVLLEWDRLDEAEKHLLRGLDLVGMGTNTYYLMTAYAALAHLEEIRGDLQRAHQQLRALEAVWPDIAFCTDGLRVLSGLRAGPEDAALLAEAAAWCRRFAGTYGEKTPPPGMGPFGAAEAFYLARLAWIRAQIALGNTEIARMTIEQQLKPALENDLANRFIELSLLEAHSWLAERDETRAQAALERALAASHPEGYVRIFDQGQPLARLLARIAGEGAYREDIRRILGSVEPALKEQVAGDGTAQAQMPGMVEGLSERELEVLHLIARGAANQEIAEELVITVGTVKSHVNHILRKLEAHNRTEAVARARRLGLVKI